MDGIFDTFKPVSPEAVDQRIVLDGVSWQEFLEIARKRDAARRRGLRLHYAEGALELMTVSHPHEYIKTTIARCLEAWSEISGVDLHGAGGWTIMNRSEERAAEPDECYHVGRKGASRPPELAIEVIWTHGGLDKLDVYQGLGVREVWIWDDGRIGIHVFERGKWSRRQRSKVLPDCDLALIERCVRTGDQPKALRMLRAALKH
ncbi:MAG: Uma2 family endonuclease [Myxococcaceae bacterium]|nr:Uma2 family endonuclease [Myxococcaceae bacterium]